MLAGATAENPRATIGGNNPPEDIIEYHRPYLYPKQHAALFDPRRYSLIEASTKAGKTSGAIVWLLEQAFAGKDGQNYWWVAPVSGQADIAFRRMQRAIPQDLQATNQTLKTITLPNGAVVWFKSADKPNSLYGEDVFAAVADEASRMKVDSWFALRSTLTATRGPVRIIGNVKGRRNWFFQMARKAEADNDNPNAAMGYHKIVAADAVAAGVLDAEEVADAKSILPPNVFKELYEAEASDDEGNPFGYPSIKKCISKMSTLPPAVWGIDVAKKRDFLSCIALDKLGQVCRHERWQSSWETSFPRVRDLIGSTPTLVDATGVGDVFVERLQKVPGSNVEGYIFTGPSKQILMEGLQLAIQSGNVTYPDGNIVLELENFEYEYTRTGVRYGAPEGFHDDDVCALALAVHHKGHAPLPLVTTEEMVAKSRQPVRRANRLW